MKVFLGTEEISKRMQDELKILDHTFNSMDYDFSEINKIKTLAVQKCIFLMLNYIAEILVEK